RAVKVLLLGHSQTLRIGNVGEDVVVVEVTAFQKVWIILALDAPANASELIEVDCVANIRKSIAVKHAVHGDACRSTLKQAVGQARLRFPDSPGVKGWGPAEEELGRSDR